MVSIFYFVVSLLAVIMACGYLYNNRRIDTFLGITICLVTVNCLGRYLLAVSSVLDVAIIANYMIYLGGCYLPLLMVIGMARLCRLRMPRILMWMLMLYSTIVMGLVLTIEKSKIYYADVQLGHADGYNYLIKTYGPLHILYTIMMIIYMIIMMWFFFYALKKRKEISSRTIITISAIGYSVTLIYLL